VRIPLRTSHLLRPTHKIEVDTNTAKGRQPKDEMASAVSRPPPPQGPPPAARRAVKPPPPPPPPRGPPPSRSAAGKGPPPRPPPRGPPPSVAGTKRPAAASLPAPPAQKPRKAPAKTILVPKTLRDVNAFTKQKQVGQGTYGYVLHASNHSTNPLRLSLTRLMLSLLPIVCVSFVLDCILVVVLMLLVLCLSS